MAPSGKPYGNYNPDSSGTKKSQRNMRTTRTRSPILRVLLVMVMTVAGLIVGVFAGGAIGVMVVYPRLPSMDALQDYRPKIPLRIFTSDGTLIGEFGEERRHFTRIEHIPLHVQQAVLAIEDDRFYEHKGIDSFGIGRALLHNLFSGSRQGASTITQQVARNFFLSSEQTYSRKFYEMLLAIKIERNLTKKQILEIYMNLIYLGQRAYGFAAAAQIYFGKPLQDISIAEAAMLAGLPKAPSTFNPVINFKRAQVRQRYILERMLLLKYINKEQFEAALAEQIVIRTKKNEFNVHAEYVAEIARLLAFDQFSEEIYTRGLNVYTTISKSDQDAAYYAVRHGVMEYEKRHGYRGPEGFVELPQGRDGQEEVIEKALTEHADSGDLIAAVVINASAKDMRAITASGEEVVLNKASFTFAGNVLSNVRPEKKLRRGSIIRITKNEKSEWTLTQLPSIESAFVSINSQDGAIRAMVGGFDFNRNKFNHVTQAWRQPGSTFKPFIYSAALEKGVTTSSMFNDAPISFSAGQTGGEVWEPKNYDDNYEGPMTVRRGLAKSKNMISVRVLHTIGVRYAHQYITRFGFDPDKNPPYLTLALGAGSVTPLQMAKAYAVFANGGYRVQPYLIAKITDANGKTLSEAKPKRAQDENNRVIDIRNAFIMNGLLKDVIKYGTATRALVLNRSDIAGKTGTTNDSFDAWFAGFHPQVVGVAWIGFDQPRNLGSRETGGGLALPIWISYMQKILPTLPVVELQLPEGIIQAGNDFYYAEHPPGSAPGNGENEMESNRPTPLEVHDPEMPRDDIRNQLF